MITMQIGETDRHWESLDEVEESWIAQQIARRRRDGRRVCVRVSVSTPGINVGLQCGECSGGGGGRLPNEDERRIVELWKRHVSNNGHCEPGGIIAFFNRLRRMI